MGVKRTTTLPGLSSRQTLVFYTTIFLLAVASFLLGYLSSEYLATRNQRFALLAEAYNLYRDNAFDALPSDEKIQHGMIRGMLAAGNDPFTTFLDPPQNELQTDQLQGKFGGIGVRIDRDNSGHILLFPLPDSPAQTSGLIDGDRLLSVDSLAITAQTTLDEVQAAIRGPIKSIVTITVERNGVAEAIKLKMQRLEVAVPSVTYNIAPSNANVGVIQINIIAASTPDEISKAITSLQTLGAQNFVLDLRNNGGGLVEGGVDSARLFLDNDLVVIEEQFRGKDTRIFRTNVRGKYAELPLVILVNRNTASAAEILAGSLQYNRRSKIVGSKTFGKDSIQMIFDLSDGSSIHVTAGKWWLPGQLGELSGNGLTPDYVLSPEAADLPDALDTAVNTFTP